MAESFPAFFRRSLPDIKHFAPSEFLVKGGSHANNNLNTDPPRDLWPNVLPLVTLLEAFRERVDKPLILSSVYRSPAYNKAIGGATSSEHMKFTAADFTVADPTSGPPDWAATLKAMRRDGMFSGGIGIYPTFVHVDVRGHDADWDERSGAKPAGRVLGPSEPSIIDPPFMPHPPAPDHAEFDAAPTPTRGGCAEFFRIIRGIKRGT